jgi:solute carrier family 13 (sodium-dependent dicarboxylate transporter), member 2/3/5
VAGITGVTVLAWATTGWHGLDAALIALAAAVVATLKPLTGIDLPSALKKVEWHLIIFLAATMLLAEALLDSGVGAQVAAEVAAAAGRHVAHPVLVVVLVSLVALGAHLVITSRTARATVLLAAVVLPLTQLGVDPMVLVMLVVLGSGYCQTLSVSAKPVAMFMHSEHHRIAPGDLARLSLALLPVMLALLVLFGTFVWPRLSG